MQQKSSKKFVSTTGAAASRAATDRVPSHTSTPRHFPSTKSVKQPEPSGVGEHRLYPPAPFDCNCPQLLSPLGLQDTLQGGAGVTEQRGGKRKGIKFLIQNNYLYQPGVNIERNAIIMMSQSTYVTVVYLCMPVFLLKHMTLLLFFNFIDHFT